jgi:hypothetical protein
MARQKVLAYVIVSLVAVSADDKKYAYEKSERRTAVAGGNAAKTK